jgi:hypothetical protein
MNRINRFDRKVIMSKTSLFAGMFVLAGFSVLPVFGEVVIYNSTDNPLPPNVVSEGFECCSTSELGNIVNPTNVGGQFASASVEMSSWALQASYPTGWGPGAPFTPSSLGYTVPLTLSIYAVGAGGAVGAELGSVTENTLIPWDIPPDDCGGDPTAHTVNGSCYHGVATLANFDLSSLNLTVPEQFIYGISYATDSYGTPTAPALGYGSPADSLNVGLETGGPSIGTDEGTSVYYVAGTPNGNVFSLNTPATDASVAGIAGYGVEAEFADNTPEPSTFGLLGIGVFAMIFAARRRRLA